MTAQKIVLFFSCLLFSSNGFSQEPDSGQAEQKTRYYTIGGLNISSLTGDDVSDVESRLSFALGFGLDYQFSENWSFAPELIYSRQGFKSDIVGVGNGIDPLLTQVIEEGVVFRQDYILLPLKIHYNPVESFYVFAGPQIALLINDSISTGNFTEEEVIGTSFAPIYFSGIVGAGVNINNNIGLRASYQFGVSRVFKDLEIPEDFFNVGETLKFKAYTSVFNLSLVYFF